MMAVTIKAKRAEAKRVRRYVLTELLIWLRDQEKHPKLEHTLHMWHFELVALRRALECIEAAAKRRADKGISIEFIHRMDAAALGPGATKTEAIR